MRRLWASVLVVLVVAGGGLRAVEAAHPTARQSADEQSYVSAAINLGDTGRYRATDLHWPPGAPALFAIAYRVHRDAVRGPTPDIPAAYWAQWLVSTATIPVVFAAGALIAGGPAGAAAAGAVALYPPAAAGPAELLSEPLGAFLVACALLALTWALARGSRVPWRFAVAGLLLGAAVLTRANLLVAPFALALILVVVLRRRIGGRRAAASAGALLAGVLLPVGAWSAAVSAATGTVVPVTNGGGTPLFVGTFLPGKGRIQSVKPVLAAETWRRFPRLRGTPPHRLKGMHVMSAVAARRPGLRRDAAIRAEAWDNVRRYASEQPLAYAGFFARKPLGFWLRPSAAGGRTGPVLRLVHAVIVLAALGGLVVGVLRTRHAALVAVAGLLACMTLLHVVVTSGPRYALPLLPVLWVGGAAGAVLALRARGSGAGGAEPD